MSYIQFIPINLSFVLTDKQLRELPEWIRGVIQNCPYENGKYNVDFLSQFFLDHLSLVWGIFPEIEVWKDSF